jgi:hypothetical protein
MSAVAESDPRSEEDDVVMHDGRRSAVIGTVLGVAVLAAACAAPAGGEGSDLMSASASQTASDPASAAPKMSEGTGGGEPAGSACDLLDTVEIESVVGNSVDEGTGMTGADCTWGSEPELTSVSLLLLDATGPQCEAALAADPMQESLEGFAAPAFWLWVGASGGVGTLSMCTAAEMITVTVSFGLDAVADEAAAREQAVELAGIVLERR